MKRGYGEPPSSSYSSSQLKRKWNSFDESSSFADESTRKARKVADHYSARSNQTLEEREASPIIHLKKLNNWIKSVLIQRYARRGDAVLDLACGKGGDLIKWDKAQIGYYVGVDIAIGSIKDCRTRYNGDADQQQRRKKFSFPARLICADCYETHLDEYLSDDAPFDICSCQAIILMFKHPSLPYTTHGQLKHEQGEHWPIYQPCFDLEGTSLEPCQMLMLLLKSLEMKKACGRSHFLYFICAAEGLTFGNSVYWISFDEEYAHKKFRSSSPFGIQYKFHLEDAVDCPEWIVPFHVFKSLAEEYDLKLVSVKNSHAFVDEFLKMPEFTELMRRLGALGDGNQDRSTLSQDEWDVAYLYLTFVLQKGGESTTSKRKHDNSNKGKTCITEEDIEILDGDI
ncbi:hypothetical protein IEQ34_017940 [Dendrobium chrysotoxum]|uniref:mRNA cap guanine-N(7) methyltransferase n=1 Tax=Dendrobium chrysotoxum TaxID=161865 RepID=A0AAV7GB03_DENCH|nr:hypothetical protein IEQ34_017940 [Dendrobium chrysotoxum]